MQNFKETLYIYLDDTPLDKLNPFQEQMRLAFFSGAMAIMHARKVAEDRGELDTFTHEWEREAALVHDELFESEMVAIDNPEVEGDAFEAGYKTKCKQCGRTPVVLVMEEGEIKHDTETCGACTWGGEAMANPEMW